MSRPARERNRRHCRRPSFLEPKPTILIVCEGEKTEPQYLNGFVADNDRRRRDVARIRAAAYLLSANAHKWPAERM